MIAAHLKKWFFAGVRSFYSAAIQYVVKKFPFNDDLLKHARFLNFLKRTSCCFSNVEYFTKLYKLVEVLRTVNEIYMMNLQATNSFVKITYPLLSGNQLW